MITEIYVPRDRLADFMHDVGAMCSGRPALTSSTERCA